MAAKKIAMFASGGTIFMGTAYVVGIAFAPAETHQVSNIQRELVWERLAKTYDSEVKMQEMYLGIGRMRKRLLGEHATGRVLEVGAGTAGNLPLYPANKCDEVVFVDRAANMVAQCMQTVESRLNVKPMKYVSLVDNTTIEERAKQQLEREKAKAQEQSADPILSSSRRELSQPVELDYQGPTSSSPVDAHTKNAALATLQREAIRKLAAKIAESDKKGGVIGDKPLLCGVCQASAEELPFPDNSFDTVVDMFGLCSYNDPVKAVTEMSRVCKPSGKLLMIEHGKGVWPKVNMYLNKWAPRHARQWGCWWNRDIRRSLRLAGVRIEHEETKHFGTTQMYVLRPAKTLKELEDERLLAAIQSKES